MEQALQPVGLERVLRCQNNCLNELAGLVAPVMGLFWWNIGYFYKFWAFLQILVTLHSDSDRPKKLLECFHSYGEAILLLHTP